MMLKQSGRALVLRQSQLAYETKYGGGSIAGKGFLHD
jgi:hypothetical protein